MAKVSSELKETVRGEESISEVHFSANGTHYFNVYGEGKTKYGRLGVEATKIVESISRANVLDAKESGINTEKK